MLEEWQNLIKFFYDTKQDLIIDTIVETYNKMFKSISFSIIPGNGFTTKHYNMLCNYYTCEINWNIGKSVILTIHFNEG